MTDLIDGLESVAFPAILAVDRAQSALSARGYPTTATIPRCAQPAPLASERWYTFVDTATHDQNSAASLQTYVRTMRIVLRSSAAFFASQVDDLNWATELVDDSPCTIKLVVRARNESGCATRAFLSASEADDPAAALADILAAWAGEEQQPHGDDPTSKDARRVRAATPVENDTPPMDCLTQALKQWDIGSTRIGGGITTRPELVPRYAVQALTASLCDVARRRVHDVPARWGALADHNTARVIQTQLSQWLFTVKTPRPGDLSPQQGPLVLLWDAGTYAGSDVQRFGPVVLASDHEPSANTYAAERYGTSLNRYCLCLLTSHRWRLAATMVGHPLSHRSVDGWALNTKGQALLGENRPSEALQFFTDALQVSRAVADEHGIIAALTGIADAARRLGQIEDAVLAEKELATFLTPAR